MKKNRILGMLCAGMMLFASASMPMPYATLQATAASDDIHTYGDFEYQDMYGNIYITAYTGKNRSVTVPNTINGKKSPTFIAMFSAGTRRSNPLRSRQISM